MFGSGSTWGQNNNQQQQQQGQQSGGLFGNTSTSFGQQNTGGFGQNTGGFGQPQQQQNTGGGLFGSSNTGNTGGFGFGSNTQTQQNNAFGARPSFGATGTSTFGSSTPAQTGGGLFGNASTTSTFGSNNATTGGGLFGSRPATSTFGATNNNTNTGGLFGSRPANSSPFGGGAASTTTNPNTVQPYSAGPFEPPPTTGTAQPAYIPTWQQDPSASSTSASSFPPHLFHVISAQHPYRGASWEELRLMDYQQNRKDASSSASTGGFGQPASTGFGQSSTGTPFGSQQPQASTSTFGAPKPAGGLFGSTPSTGGFGSTSGGFGSTSTPANTGGGLFGQQQPQQGTSNPFGSTQPQQQTGGLFGQQPSQPASGGLFGNTSTTFGSNQQNQQQNTSSFGGFGASKPAFGATGTTGGFGSTSTNTFGQQQPSTGTSTFGSFGQNQQQQPQQQQSSGGLFGNTSTGFGSTNTQNTGTGLFGSTPQNQQNQHSGGLFGNTQQKSGGLFGSTTAGNTGSSSFSFGQNNNTTTQPSTGGLFGSSTNSTTGQSGGLFGQQPQQQQQQQQQPGQTGTTGGLFGNTNTGSSLFGAKPATGQTGGLFGSTQPQQPAQQQSSLFGNTSTNPSVGLFGSSTSTFGQQNQQNQQKPAGSLFGGGGSLFGSQPQQQTQQPAQSTGGLFGNLGQSQPASTSLFGSQPQQNTTQPAFGGSLFGGGLGQSTTQPAQQQATLTASIDQNPYGRNDLFNYTGQKLDLGSINKKPALPPLASSTFRVTPTKSQLHKLRGFASPLSQSQSPGRAGTPLSLSSPSRLTFVSSPGSTDRYKGLTDAALPPNAFVPRPSYKKLTSTKSPIANGDDPSESALGKSALKSVNGTPRSDNQRNGTSPGGLMFNSSQANGSSSHAPARRDNLSNSLRMSGSERQPKKGEYWCRPRMERLRQLTAAELKSLNNFTAGRKGYGEVTFLEPVDLTGVDLADLLGTVIVFSDMELAVYPDSYEDKPARGKGLNVPAQITLENCWPKDKASKEIITDMTDPRHVRFLKRVKNIPETEFVSYTDDGLWTFKVQHFSRYGIDEDEESEVESVATRQTDGEFEDESQEASEGSAEDDDPDFTSPESTSAEEISDEDFLPPTKGLHDDEDSEESTSHENTDAEGSLYLTEASSMDVEAPPSAIDWEQGFQQKLGNAGMRKLKEMQASLFHDTSKQDQARKLLDKQKRELERHKRAREVVGGQDFDMAEGEKDAIDTRAIQRTSFGYQPDPRQLRQPRKYARVALKDSSDNDNEGVKADAGLALGRSFRVSWGPNGELIHLGKVCKPTEQYSAPAQSEILIEDMGLLAESSDLEKRKAERLIKLHLDQTDITIDNGIPSASINSRIRFKDFSQLFDSGDRSHEANIWRLCTALFDEIDLHLSEDTDEDQVLRISEIRRKLALSHWLEDAVSPTVDHDLLKANGGPEKVFTYLSGNQLERAVQAALDNNDMRLATLVSQVGSAEVFKAEVMRQLEDWKKYKATSMIGQAYRRIYALLAGIMEVLPGDSSRGVDGCPDIVISKDLDWKRAFGLRLWHGAFEDTIGDVLTTYSSQLKDAHPPPKPLPPYLESPSDLAKSWTMNDEPTDILFGLIRLYADITVSLDQVLQARNCSPSPLDARLQWHLYLLLSKVLRKRDFEDRQDDYSATADSITAAYAAQLEQVGSWTQSAFVLLHLETAEGRQQALKALLSRHSDPSEEEATFLINKLQIPSTWLAEAKAARLSSSGDAYGEYYACIDAQLFDRAHRILIDILAIEPVLRGDNKLLETLCSALAGEDKQPNRWEYGGKLFLDYIAIVDDLPSVLSAILRGPQAGSPLSVRATQLAQSIPRVLTLLPALFPKKDDVQQVAALGDMLSNLHQLAAQVHLAGYIPRPHVSDLLVNADRLNLLQSSSLESFEASLASVPAAA